MFDNTVRWLELRIYMFQNIGILQKQLWVLLLLSMTKPANTFAHLTARENSKSFEHTHRNDEINYFQTN